MKVLVTGSAGHLGEALMRWLPARGVTPVGLDIRPSDHTEHVGSVGDRDLVRRAAASVDAIIHAATLHKPHVVTHSKRDFIEANVAGTQTLLEAAIAAGQRRFVFTSTTSAFGRTLRPMEGAPAVWVDEAAQGLPKNIYGATKTAAEDLCALAHHESGLGVVALRVSRFFPEDDDDAETRRAFTGENAKANEFLYRRVDIEDAAEAHLLALERAGAIGFGKYIISATTPFEPAHLPRLRTEPGAVVASLFPHFEAIYARVGFRMFESLDRVYDNSAARAALGWRPVWDFERVLGRIEAGAPIGSDLARAVGKKPYHDRAFADGPYPVS